MVYPFELQSNLNYPTLSNCFQTNPYDFQTIILYKKPGAE